MYIQGMIVENIEVNLKQIVYKVMERLYIQTIKNTKDNIIIIKKKEQECLYLMILRSIQDNFMTDLCMAKENSIKLNRLDMAYGNRENY